MLPGVSLQPVALVLLEPWVTAGGSGLAGAAVQNGGTLTMAKTPQNLQRGMLGMPGVAEGAWENHWVAINCSDLRLHINGPVVICGAQDCSANRRITHEDDPNPFNSFLG